MSAAMFPDKLKIIVEGLFLKHDPMTWHPMPYGWDVEDTAGARQVSNAKLVAVANMFRKVMQKCFE